MTIRVLFFGLTHDLTGFDEERVELPEGGRLADLWRRYEIRFPKLGEVLPSLLTAVNQEIAERSQPLRDGDEVAFLPPVSGGAPEDFCRITRDVIPTQDLANELKAPEEGGVVVFEGIVRTHSRGRKTLYLEYEAYEPMAKSKMRQLAAELRRQFHVSRVVIVHRLGQIEIGEASILIGVSSPHRQASFDACRYAIDTLKRTVPIWKKEFFEDGAVWAEGEGQMRVLVEARGQDKL